MQNSAVHAKEASYLRIWVHSAMPRFFRRHATADVTRVDDFDRGGAGFGFCLAGVGGVP